ncbi:MAG: ComEC/Rec2 family competence protein [Clostridia bacterium]|nr:ComEC/Rec2 family competence protein [Clostridia bacterium]
MNVISLCLLISSVLGVLCSRSLVLVNDKRVEEFSGEHLLSGYVLDVASREEYFSEYLVRVEELDKERRSFDLLLITEYNSELERGDFIEWIGDLIPSQNYGKALYLLSNSVYDYPLACVLKSGAEIVYNEREFRFPLMLSDLNSKLSATLKATLGTKNGSLASALLLGNRDLLSDSTLRDFKRAGVYHLLALSGLHVAILIGILEWILKKCFIPTKLRIFLLGSMSLFYIALTGFALSACRSMLMLWVVYISLLLQRKRDVMTSLFLAVSVIVLLKPSAVLDVGLQLSFLSTFGVISSTLICKKLKLLGKKFDKSFVGLIKSLAYKCLIVSISSLCVFICTLPVVMICFGEVSLATFVSNLFIGAVCEIFMILALLTLFFARVLFIYPVFGFFAGLVGNMMTSVVSLIADMESIMLSLRYPGAQILVWGLFLAFIVMLAVRLGRKWTIFVPSAIFGALICVSILFYNASRADFVRAEYYYGDGIVLSSSEGIYICDMSDGSFGNLYEGVAIAKENCFTEIDGVILTHYHADHVISLKRFAREFMVRAVFLPMPQNEKENLNMRSIVRVLNEEGVEAYIYSSNEVLNILSGELVLSDRAYTGNYAHPSYVLTYKNGESRISFIGKPYFNTYLEESRAFADYINGSNYLIIGSDGRKINESFELFTYINDECETSFADRESFLLSDYEEYMDWMKIYFDVEYKKYDLK